MTRWPLAALASTALLGIAACSSTGSADPSTSKPGASSSTNPGMNSSALNKTLQAYHWDLESAQDQSGRALPSFTALAPKTAVRLNFSAGSQPGQQLVSTKICNNLGGSYQLDGDKITIGNMISTQMACADGRVMQLEQAVGAQLPRAQSVRIAQDANPQSMVLSFNDGSRWNLKAVPTNATKYGNAGETIFLEVGPQTKPCSAGVMRTQCLQVRDVHYDSAGRKTTTGEWGNFYGNIEGYQHEPGIRNVLRVKRYTVQNPPADASRYAYVLDMTVESERTK
ncbi:META and DUF4377 domain-containing protein [Comamonas odontotermitis]|uniref:META and DUF4377 domain-containing protein n=1 Tax=Comamonas odontotermitis TaxID=379895 RepID=UPI001CC7D2DE|nr:META and DUF4377 domain-containing protein [Comamonas odontotermitis]UBB18306.1 META and DUF4377 domain-containing protein [Comamonas odontotermitis]